MLVGERGTVHLEGGEDAAQGGEIGEAGVGDEVHFGGFFFGAGGEVGV